MHHVIRLWLVVSFVCCAPVTALQAQEGPGDMPTRSEPLAPAYPDWPERRVREDVVPPPPGGPYMSTALMGIDRFPASAGGMMQERSADTDVPSPFFEPDTAWPEPPRDRGMPERWLPPDGEYHFVPEETVRELEHIDQYGYPRQPVYPGPRVAPAYVQPGGYYGAYPGRW